MRKSMNVRVPVVRKGDIKMFILVGEPEIALGEVLDLRETGSNVKHGDEYVREVLVNSILDLEASVVDSLGFANNSALRVGISEAHGVSLPAETIITVLVTGDAESDLGEVFVEDVPEQGEEDSDFTSGLFDFEDSPEAYDENE